MHLLVMPVHYLTNLTYHAIEIWPLNELHQHSKHPVWCHRFYLFNLLWTWCALLLYMIPVFGASHLGKSHRCNILAGKVFMVNWWWYLITSCCNVYSLHSVDFPTDDCVTICDLNQNYCSEAQLFLFNHVETMETSILDTWTSPKKVCFAFVWFYFSYVIYMLHLCSVLTRCSTSSSVRSHCMPSRSVSLGPRFRQRFW